MGDIYLKLGLKCLSLAYINIEISLLKTVLNNVLQYLTCTTNTGELLQMNKK